MGSKSKDSLKKNLRTYWNNLTPSNQKLLKFLPLFLIILSLPLSVWFVGQTQNTQQKAVAPDQLEAEGGVLGGNATIVTDTSASGGKSVMFSQSTPTPTASSVKIVTVSSISALKTALADNTIDEIVVKNGTYHVSPAANQASDSLWIGAKFAERSRPVLVRAETTDGVKFDGGGATYFGGITFVEGTHDQTWQGFRFTNGEPTGTGVIVFGGYSLLAPPHHITLRNITVSGLTGSSLNGYPIYFSMAASPGPHDLLIEDFTAIDNGASKALIHFYHDSAGGDPAGNYNAQNVVIRRAHLTGTPQPVMIWARSLTNLLIEDTTIVNATETAIRYEYGSGVVLRRVVSTGSPGGRGFYSSLGTNPPQVTFDNCSLK